MVWVYAFALGLVGFSLALVGPSGPPVWLWSLNALALASGVCSAAYWYRQANR
jgi:hypothetical protein